MEKTQEQIYEMCLAAYKIILKYPEEFIYIVNQHKNEYTDETIIAVNGGGTAIAHTGKQYIEVGVFKDEHTAKKNLTLKPQLKDYLKNDIYNLHSFEVQEVNKIIEPKPTDSLQSWFEYIEEVKNKTNENIQLKDIFGKVINPHKVKPYSDSYIYKLHAEWKEKEKVKKR